MLMAKSKHVMDLLLLMVLKVCLLTVFIKELILTQECIALDQII